MTVSLQQKQSMARHVARVLSNMPLAAMIEHRLIKEPDVDTGLSDRARAEIVALARADLIETVWSVVQHLEHECPAHEITLEPPAEHPLRNGSR